MSANNDELRQIVTDALVGMISGVTGLVPPSGPGAIPDFVQAPIDRAVEKISTALPVGVPDGYALVPIEPTPEMMQAALDKPCFYPNGDLLPWSQITRAAYFAMLAAAPAAPTVKADPPESITAAVDAAMVEMQNISPPLRRSECERLIRAALPALRALQGGDA
ncbi:hypothetical protein ACRS3X_17185 [Ectopseudomonas hydrolytica]|uniref:hypothetical protein n=1 Tax=Ectopseudomonas hydrolytica TaxID=2493633 RepID=UPI003EDFFB06